MPLPLGGVIIDSSTLKRVGKGLFVERNSLKPKSPKFSEIPCLPTTATAHVHFYGKVRHLPVLWEILYGQISLMAGALKTLYGCLRFLAVGDRRKAQKRNCSSTSALRTGL
jgi:hypothetical protein